MLYIRFHFFIKFFALFLAMSPINALPTSDISTSGKEQADRIARKYTGTTHADKSKLEWQSSVGRDSNSAIVGLPTLNTYVAIAKGGSQKKN